MTTSILTLAPRIRIPTAPTTEVNEALRLIGYEFCRRTSAWRVTLDETLAAEAQTTTIALDASVDGIIGKVVKVTINDGTSYIKTLPSKYYTLDDDGVLTWTDYFAASGDILYADVVVWPNLTCYTYPDQIIDRHGMTLVHGAKASLLSMNVPAWRDLQGADLEREDYERGVRRTICGKSRKTGSFFRFKPPASILPNAPGTPISSLQNYEPTTTD